MIRTEDVNSAMLQQAAEELEIGVPIRSWRVEAGELVLSLAYGGEAVWRPPGARRGKRKKDRARTVPEKLARGRPWRFVEEQRDATPRPIPEGDLNKVKKQQLGLIALSWGYQTETLDPLKAELVEALAWARDNLED